MSFFLYIETLQTFSFRMFITASVMLSGVCSSERVSSGVKKGRFVEHIFPVVCIFCKWKVCKEKLMKYSALLMVYKYNTFIQVEILLSVHC